MKPQWLALIALFLGTYVAIPATAAAGGVLVTHHSYLIIIPEADSPELASVIHRFGSQADG